MKGSPVRVRASALQTDRDRSYGSRSGAESPVDNPRRGTPSSKPVANPERRCAQRSGSLLRQCSLGGAGLTLRVLIVAEIRLYREGLAEMLQGEPAIEVVATASGADEA